MPDPQIAFVTTCKNRTQHLRETLPANLAHNSDYPAAKFVVLDYGSEDDLLQYLHSELLDSIKSGRLVVYSFPTSGSFKMSNAKNLAHRLGMLEGAEILVNLDADNFTGLGVARDVADQFGMAGTNAFLWAKMVKGEMSRGISGRIAVWANAFLKAGGYDEKYETWAPDDKDFNLRLRRLGYAGVEIDPRFLLAVKHNDKMRFREYPQAMTTMGEEQFELAESQHRIANYGNFGCATVYRNFDKRSPIKLGPLPTRIFGIGLHKTATTSLHTALTVLGFDSAHWTTAHWAKAIWVEMMAEGHSLMLERHYAVSDLPIPLLYEKLDRAYPGSKFILTVRDEDRWAASARKHWHRDQNPWRSAWDHDPFSHFIHKELYGRKDFDEATFRARYRRHNGEVLEYFRFRPTDLLVLDVDKGEGWLELCGFLGKPIPDAAYPGTRG